MMNNNVLRKSNRASAASANALLKGFQQHQKQLDKHFKKLEQLPGGETNLLLSLFIFPFSFLTF